MNCYVELKDYGGDPIRIPVPRSGSWVKKEVKDIVITTGGGKFSDFSGNQRDVLAILKENGVNFVRLRIWNDPKNGICGEESTLAMARRIKAAGPR